MSARIITPPDSHVSTWIDCLGGACYAKLPSMSAAVKTSKETIRGEWSITPPTILRAETNFLRFPFFTLSSKNIHQIDSREVSGTRKIKTETGESQELEFLYRVSRNSDHMFPGQLSRKIHFALLSLLAKQGPKPQNPVCFSWRELAREMGTSFGGGKMVESMKAAIRSTHGTIIRSEHAIIDGTGERRKAIKRERGMHLYHEYVFRDEVLDDGTIADRNQVYFSDWYMANLQALYVAPIDFDCWKRLNDKTPVASRLYEYLVFVFGNGSLRRLSYQKIAASIPLTAQPYESLMKKQLNPAFQALIEEGIIAKLSWTEGKYGDVVLCLSKGPNLRPITNSTIRDSEGADDEAKTKEVINPLSPSDRIILDYYQRRFGIENHRITTKERLFVSQLLDRCGLDRLTRAIPKVVRRMKQEYPAGQNIASAESILEQVIAGLEKSERPVSGKPESPSVAPIKTKQQSRKEKRETWNSLPASQQETIHKIVRGRLPKSDVNSVGYQIMLLDEAARHQSFFLES